MKEVNLIKETGATFTPKKLANFLAKRILSYIEIDQPLIVDPACGDGALLTSIGNQLDSQKRKYSILGYDTNFDYLITARKNLTENISSKFHLENEDFLEKTDIDLAQQALNFEENKGAKNNFADIIIANPPYVRTQILGAEKAQFLAKKYNLKGRVDLYYPFLIAMTSALKEGGLVGVITSNKFLVTKSGNSIRKFLFENFDILEVIDLGDTKLFDAAVLPAIFIGRKKKNASNRTAKFLKIYEENNEYTGNFINSVDVFDILNSKAQGYFSDGLKRYKKSSGIIKFTQTKENNWAMLSKSEANWVAQIENNSFETIGDSFKVRVGIKTTADKVFIRDSWDELNGNKPEDENLKELLSQENIKPWGFCKKKQLKVLYPYISENSLKKLVDVDQYPKTKKYLEAHSEILKGRKYVTNSGRKWFEIWVPQNPFLWKFPKLVFPDISAVPRFYFDNSGKIVNGNCYWIVATEQKDKDKLLLIQGISNSKLMTKYHDLVFSNKLYSGRRRYFSQYVQNYPLPNINSPESLDVIRLVKKINNTSDETKTKKLVHTLEVLVAKTFGVEPVFNLD
ncbi:modification methylase PaeR7I [Kordia sp. SMS9]|uniref:Eco57I restriction-modification methylase domain-containing protein n=1 Tax=Kordia sp. SMS9 TaxID=2282170 RepID=UPI000E0D9233|nr:N-6 DNA methylase [Kordia sp. SMS9]AXG67844.1 modification methylase PaeR7I [Kordia sp. SMS9]